MTRIAILLLVGLFTLSACGINGEPLTPPAKTAAAAPASG